MDTIEEIKKEIQSVLDTFKPMKDLIDEEVYNSFISIVRSKEIDGIKLDYPMIWYVSNPHLVASIINLSRKIK